MCRPDTLSLPYSMICNTLSAIETTKIIGFLYIVKKLAWSDTGSMTPVPLGSGGPEGKLKVWIERCTWTFRSYTFNFIMSGESQFKLQIVPSLVGTS